MSLDGVKDFNSTNPLLNFRDFHGNSLNGGLPSTYGLPNLLDLYVIIRWTTFFSLTKTGTQKFIQQLPVRLVTPRTLFPYDPKFVRISWIEAVEIPSLIIFRNFSFNSLAGSIPSTIENATALRNLYVFLIWGLWWISDLLWSRVLSSNQLNGTLPAGMGSLANEVMWVTRKKANRVECSNSRVIVY